MRRNALTIVEQRSPLDYHGHHPARLALVDPTAGPPGAGDAYFAGRTKKITRGAGGRPLKKPRTEVTPGAGEGVVAFVDFDVTPDWLVIHYVTTRQDQRGKGHMRRLLDALLERHGDESQFVSFGDVHSESVWRYAKKLEEQPRWAGKVRAKMRFNPGEDGEVWTRGACGTFAAVLHRLTGLPIYATLWTAPEDATCVEVVHAFVMTPDGSRLDADGASKAPPIGVVARVWEAGIGDDVHPDSGEKGQWWDEETRPLMLRQLAEVRAASEDVNDREWQAKAEDWIERNRPLFERWIKTYRNPAPLSNEEAQRLIETGAEQVVGTPGSPAIEDFVWTETTIPVSELAARVVRGFRTTRQAKKWFEAEMADDERRDYLEHLEESVASGGVSDPLTVADLGDGWLDLCDGWHRMALAIKYGIKDVPAYVGKLRGRASNPARNSDERRRAVERRVAAGGTVEDDARLLVERVRAGELSTERVEAAASLGHLAARMLTPVTLVELPVRDNGEYTGEWLPFARRFMRRFPLESVMLMIEIERAMLPMVRWYTHDTSNDDEELPDYRRCLDASHAGMEPGTCPRSRFLPAEIAFWNAVYDEMRHALLEGRRPRDDVEIPPDALDAAGELWGHWDLGLTNDTVHRFADRGLEAAARNDTSSRDFREVLTLFHAWRGDDHVPPLESRPTWIAQHLAALILDPPPPPPAKRNPHRNMDERRRKLERRARASGSLEDAARAAVDAERADGGQARRIDRMVRYGVWRVGEVMNPRDPNAWERNSEHVTTRKIAELVLRASTGAGDVLLRDVVSEQFRQRRLCVEERHDRPCVYDGCVACEEECVPPEDGGGAPRYDWKTASALVMAHGDELAIGIRAMPSLGGPSGVGRSSLGVMVHGSPRWDGDDGLRRRCTTLDQYEEDLVDVDDVRVWDNGGRTADRFTILMQGEIPKGDDDGEPFHITITSNSYPNHPQGFWMRSEATIDLDDTEQTGVEQEPWTELLPRGVLDAIWADRGAALVVVPRQFAERWAVLKLAGYFE